MQLRYTIQSTAKLNKKQSYAVQTKIGWSYHQLILKARMASYLPRGTRHQWPGLMQTWILEGKLMLRQTHRIHILLTVLRCRNLLLRCKLSHGSILDTNSSKGCLSSAWINHVLILLLNTSEVNGNGSDNKTLKISSIGWLRKALGICAQKQSQRSSVTTTT